MIALTVVLADAERTLWYVTLGFGLVVALAVAFLLLVLLRYLRSIETGVSGLLAGAGRVAENTANIPQLEATGPVVEAIGDEGVVQDAYMNALTEGYAGEAK